MPVIVHTTDLSGDDSAAFAHAVALAARRGAKLCSVHACTGPAPERGFPDATRLLESWRSEREPVAHEAMLHQCCDDVTDTLLDALRRVEPELVVTATHGRTGVARIFSESVAESVARNVKVPTLIVPLAGDGFVDPATGAVRLGRVLVPVGNAGDAERGLRAAVWLLELAAVGDAEVVLLHVDDGTPMPAVTLPEGVTTRVRLAKGALEDAIVEAAKSERACVIVMATHGHDSMSDVLFGSHTERVLGAAGCPILSVPLA
ncbi:MAG: universal stress protein [Myxococcales bacterium]|nr:universal stress protein [Myxococcales bacterium]